MFRDPQTMLAYEAKRSPDLAAMITNIETLSEDAIRAAKVKMPWIRQALLALKKTASTKQFAVAIEDFIVDKKLADPVGRTVRWNGDTCFIKIGRKRSLLEIRTGQLVWLDGKGGAWFDTLYSDVLDPMLLPRSVMVADMTRLAYMDMLRADRNKTIDQVPQTIVAGAEPAKSSLFTIFRPG